MTNHSVAKCRDPSQSPVNRSNRLLQLMQADPHKLDFRSELLARLPGAGGLGPLGPIGGALPPTHDLTRPPSLFSATGAWLNMFVCHDRLTDCEFIADLSDLTKRCYLVCCLLVFYFSHHIKTNQFLLSPPAIVCFLIRSVLSSLRFDNIAVT